MKREFVQKDISSCLSREVLKVIHSNQYPLSKIERVSRRPISRWLWTAYSQ